MPLQISYSLDTLRGDIFGGLTASVVALPVALAFGVVSGLGPMAGMYGVIAVGFFAAVFGGTRSQISGPTGPMSVAVAVVVATHADNLAEAFTIVMMAGLIPVLLGVLKIGRYIVYTPYSVISGFMSGIGVIIMLLQIGPFLGSAGAPGGVVGAVFGLPEVLAQVNLHALAVGACTLLVGVVWPGRIRKFLPAPLAALIAGSALGILWLNDLPIIGDIPTGLPSLQTPTLSADLLINAIEPAVILALLGSIDSLLTSLIADSLTRTRHNPNRELVGQGIGNMVAGFVGGLPGAGATMGTVVNIRAGGRTQVSGVIRAVILLALVLGLGALVKPIPHAVLAGIMVKVGWDVMDWRMLRRIHRLRRDHLVVMLMTFALAIFLDLVTAVAIGLIAAGMASARLLERQELDNVISAPLLDRTFLSDESVREVEEADAYAARVGIVTLRGRFSVASSSNLTGAIGEDIRDHEVVIIDFSDTVYLDDSAAMVVEHMINVALKEDTEPIILGLSGSVEGSLKALNILGRVPQDRFVATLDEAREVARRLLEG